jgi:hypothetical protein
MKNENFGHVEYRNVLLYSTPNIPKIGAISPA